MTFVTKAEDDGRIVHRLEAFSDIVIGFCIAEVGLGLRLPASVHDFARAPTTVFQFGLSFMLIAALWWLHNRLFANYFVPNRISIILNFMLLGALVLTVYFFQAFRSLPSTSNLPAAYWLASFGVVYLLIGVLWAIGVTGRWSMLTHTLECPTSTFLRQCLPSQRLRLRTEFAPRWSLNAFGPDGYVFGVALTRCTVLATHSETGPCFGMVRSR